MTKSTKLIALVLVLAMLCLTLASCGMKLSGEYSAKVEALGQSVETIYDFSGSKYTMTVKTTVLGKVNTESIEGTYEIAETEDGKLEITFSVEGEDGKVETTTNTLEKGEDYIKIGLIQYNAVK